MTLFTRSLWPDTVAHPIRKLVLAMIAAPLAVLVLLVLVAFLVSGMTRPTQGEALAYTLDIVPMLAAALFGFMASFGAFGVGILWAFAQRGILVWALTGALMGALAGTVLGFVVENGPNRMVLLSCAFLGWVLFLLVRRFARVQSEAPEREPS